MIADTRCPNCGRTALRAYCTECGTHIESAAAVDSHPSAWYPEDLASPPDSPQRDRDGGPRPLRRAGALALALMVAAGIVTAVLVTRGASSSEVPDPRDQTAPRSRPEVSATRPPTPSPTAAPTTSPPAVLPTAPVLVPVAFVVRVDCSNARCALSVRETPSVTARQTGMLSDAQTVYVSCATAGAPVTDADGRGTSSSWLRLADGSGYISSLYALGPQPRPC